MTHHGTVAAPPGSAAASAASLPEGHLDHVSPEGLWGWAFDPAAPGAPVQLRIVIDGVPVAELEASINRDDLPPGALGFEFPVVAGLEPDRRHVVRVQRVADGADLANSPWVLPAALLGFLDSVTPDHVRGWACDTGSPGLPVLLDILDNGVPVARIAALEFRQDVRDAGFGEGLHGFDVAIPGGLSPSIRHVVEVRRQTDGAPLPGGPKIIEPIESFAPALEQAIADALAGLAEPDRARALGTITARAARLAAHAAHHAPPAHSPASTL